MKFGVILAARTNSRRLPGKAMLPLMGLPVTQLLIKRIKTSKLADKIILATSDLPGDDALAEIAKKEGIGVFRGSLNDVLGRYVQAGKLYDFDYCIRITGDEPFLDGPTLDYVIQKAIEIKDFDMVTSNHTFTPGIGYEIYPKALLEKIDSELNPTEEEREHVTLYIYQKKDLKKYKIFLLDPLENLTLKDRIFLLDTQEDYEAMQKLTEGVADIYTTPQQFVEIYKQSR